jgi:hypothetical protein
MVATQLSGFASKQSMLQSEYNLSLVIQTTWTGFQTIRAAIGTKNFASQFKCQLSVLSIVF